MVRTTGAGAVTPNLDTSIRTRLPRTGRGQRRGTTRIGTDSVQELISYVMSMGLTVEQATRMALDHINPSSPTNAPTTQAELQRLMVAKGFPPELAGRIAPNVIRQGMRSPADYPAMYKAAANGPQERRDAQDRLMLQALAEQETRRL